MRIPHDFYDKLDRFFGTEPEILRGCTAVAEYLEATDPENLEGISEAPRHE